LSEDVGQPQGPREQAWSVRAAQAAAKIRADLAFAGLDLVLVACAYLAVLALRFDGGVPPEWWRAFGLFIPVAVSVHFVSNWAWGLYGQIWRHAGIREARTISLAGACSGVFLSVLYLSAGRRMPASVVVLGALLATALSGGLRFQSRLFAYQRAASSHEGRRRLVVVGAGEAGATLVRDMLENRTYGMRPVAILDDDPRKQGRSLAKVPIVGGIDRLGETVERYAAELVILAVPSADADFVRRVVKAADEIHVTVKVLPSVAELLGGHASVRDVRDLSIADLLGRQQVSTDLDAVRDLISGRRVIITGAGGSIGSELARQVAACDPSVLVLLDHDETHLHDAAARLERDSEQVLADVRNRDDVDRVFERCRPEIVFHAAAHKHVPLLERHPCAAAETNVMGTLNVVNAAKGVDVERLVFISTDKAVRPLSVMGASKRVGELIVVEHADARPWCAVRFGNVLGSRGSVVPTFVRQIQQGGPVTVTDPRMTRFFMSIEEAVQLVLQAAALAEGGEIFMLDMGQPVRIVELAERMIRLSGRRVGEDIAIEFTGVRPGEKLVEELRSSDEEPQPTQHPAIVSLRPTLPAPGQLDAHLSRIAGATYEGDGQKTSQLLFELAVPHPHPADDLEVANAALLDGTGDVSPLSGRG
jgi:FlaA1/EpsC-like NDP-sugar epimerase